MKESRIVAWIEIAGGARPLPERLTGSSGAALGRAVWWLVLFALAVAFAGWSTKFVYVDF